MNLIHWKTIEHKVGQETLEKLRILSDFYRQTRVSDYYNKTSTLIRVGESINNTNTAELVVCPHFGEETIRGLPSSQVNLIIHDCLPKRLLGFKKSGLMEVLNDMRLSLKVIISTKEFVEVNDPRGYTGIVASIQNSRSIIQEAFRDLEVGLMEEREVVNYRDNFMPDDHLDRKWPEGFWIPQARHGLDMSKTTDCISIQSEVTKFEYARSFYKEAFGKETQSIIGYRVPKSY